MTWDAKNKDISFVILFLFFEYLYRGIMFVWNRMFINGSQLAKMKKYIPYMSLP